jgi:polyisoprenoid-binding protein YceI
MATQRWEIDSSHSGIHFSVRHLVIAKVRGQFSRWSGAVVVPDGDFSKASIEAVIDASSIETGVADRDAHLKSADFFDVAQFPEVRFNASRVEAKGADELRLVGQLTIKGITREVALEVEQLGQVRPGSRGRGLVDRRRIRPGAVGLDAGDAIDARRRGEGMSVMCSGARPGCWRSCWRWHRWRRSSSAVGRCPSCAAHP